MFARGFKTWCENVAAQQRRELSLQPSDPLDMWLLAEYLGVRIWTPEEVPGLDPKYLKILLRQDTDSWSAVTIRVGSNDLIILNSSHSGGRPASNLAHELSHLLIGHRPAHMYIPEDGLMLATYDQKQEREADWLAGCLLLPREALALIIRQKMDRGDVRRKYGVSQDMFQYRLNVTGIQYQFGGVRRRSRTR